MTLKSWGMALLVAALVRPLVLALAGWLVLRVSGIRSPASRHTVWTAVLIGILILPVASVITPHWNLPILPATGAVHVHPGALPYPVQPGSSSYGTGSVNRMRPPVESRTDVPALVIWLYSAGLMVMFTYQLLGWVLLRRLLAKSRPLRECWLRESANLRSPVVAGVLRPTLLLPSDWREWSAQKRRMVFAHEFAHLRRRDPLILALARITRSLFWFHPLVWWITRRLSELSELACDAVVLEKMNDAAAYSRVLLEFAEAVNCAGRRVALPGVAMAVSSGIAERVDQLFELSSTSARCFARPGLLLAITGLPVMCLAATVGLTERSVQRSAPSLHAPRVSPAATTRPAVNEKSSPVRQFAQARTNAPSASALETPWTKWLNEDVAYIITDQERQAFEALQTDQERENFVEQFWLRRDPTPDTVENEYKEEHYRRIAYANDHFTSAVPGWKTDRGRIYITFGPPDELESHPSAGTYERPASEGGGAVAAYPFEDWLYRHIQGIGKNVIIEFVDREMTGDYHMTTNSSEKLASLNPLQDDAAGAPGAVTVEVTQDRRPVVQIPFVGPMFHALVRVSRPNGRPVSTVMFAGTLCGNTSPAGCLAEPVYRPDLQPLEPGIYVLNVAIKNYPSGTLRSYTVPFTVQ